MTKYIVSNIDWDVDSAEDLNDLPTTCIIDAFDEDDIADALSDKYGFCVNGFSIKKKKKYKNIWISNLKVVS